MKQIFVALVLLVSSFALADSSEKIVPHDQQRGCAFHYAGMSILRPFKLFEYKRVFALLSDADGIEGSSGKQLKRMIKKVRKDCFGAGLDDVRDLLVAADDRYAFCQRNAKGYDLFNRKRIQAYLVEELQRSRPELCR